ncbi:MAG: ribosomal L7Ae/L30e/S12e/Gadd45 family protein [Eubacteriales bacterium]
MREKIESYMGFARKARALLVGTDTCIIAMKKKKLKLLIIAADAATNSVEKLRNTAIGNGVEFRVFSNKEKLSSYVGMQNKIAFGITDFGFANVILKEIDSDVRK